jgi:sulfite exporter TauE/SafE
MYESLLAAMLLGLFAGGHCLAMCGGVVTALTLAGGQPAGSHRIVLLVAYNVGRLASYVAAGVIAGGLGEALIDAGGLVGIDRLRCLLLVLSSLFMFAVALYLGGWWGGLVRLEEIGGLLWRRLQPYARRLVPVRSVGQALLFGAFWGWLPCGLVYTALIWAISSGSAGQGGLQLLAFGLGTLPNLLLIGVAAGRVQRWMRQPWVRQTVASSVALLALLPLYRLVGSGGCPIQ